MVNSKYKIKFVDKIKNRYFTLKSTENRFFLEIAEENNIILPYSCCSGSCSSCLGRINSLDTILSKIFTIYVIDQSDQNFLNTTELLNGFVLLCIAYPKMDLTILINQEENLY
jgi:2Fe-2S type ferredoxin